MLCFQYAHEAINANSHAGWKLEHYKFHPGLQVGEANFELIYTFYSGISWNWDIQSSWFKYNQYDPYNQDGFMPFTWKYLLINKWESTWEKAERFLSVFVLDFLPLLGTWVLMTTLVHHILVNSVCIAPLQHTFLQNSDVLFRVYHGLTSSIQWRYGELNSLRHCSDVTFIPKTKLPNGTYFWSRSELTRTRHSAKPLWS